MIWKKAAKGIRYREHEHRRYGNHLDRYYAIYYKVNGKYHTEALGWESENRVPGQSMLQRATEMLAQIFINRRSGVGPVTKHERIEAEKLKKRAEEEKKSRADQETVTLRNFFYAQYEPFIKRKLKTKSISTEVSNFKNWIEPCCGNKILGQIDFSCWDQLISKLSEKNLTIRTKIYTCGTLSRVLKLAVERGINVLIPTLKQLGLRQTNNRRERVITDEEMEKILNELKNLNINSYYITLFAYYTCCRFGEAANLKWIDINQNEIIFKNTKNGTNRAIPITDNIKILLNSLDKTSPYVFLNTKNSKYRYPPPSFKLAVSRLGLNDNRSEYDKITFHNIRHTVATKLGDKVNVSNLQKIGGWKTVKMAARYMHENREIIKNALDDISSFHNNKE